MPHIERSNRNFFESRSSLISGRSFSRMIRAKSIATKLRKKLFWIEGRSPDRRTNIFMRAKEKEESRIQQTPLFFCVIVDTSFLNAKTLGRCPKPCKGNRSSIFPAGRRLTLPPLSWRCSNPLDPHLQQNEHFAAVSGSKGVTPLVGV